MIFGVLGMTKMMRTISSASLVMSVPTSMDEEEDLEGSAIQRYPPCCEGCFFRIASSGWSMKEHFKT